MACPPTLPAGDGDEGVRPVEGEHDPPHPPVDVRRHAGRPDPERGDGGGPEPVGVVGGGRRLHAAQVEPVGQRLRREQAGQAATGLGDAGGGGQLVAGLGVPGREAAGPQLGALLGRLPGDERLDALGDPPRVAVAERTGRTRAGRERPAEPAGDDLVDGPPHVRGGQVRSGDHAEDVDAVVGGRAGHPDRAGGLGGDDRLQPVLQQQPAVAVGGQPLAPAWLGDQGGGEEQQHPRVGPERERPDQAAGVLARPRVQGGLAGQRPDRHRPGDRPQQREVGPHPAAEGGTDGGMRIGEQGRDGGRRVAGGHAEHRLERGPVRGLLDRLRHSAEQQPQSGRRQDRRLRQPQPLAEPRRVVAQGGGGPAVDDGGHESSVARRLTSAQGKRWRRVAPLGTPSCSLAHAA
ncbi:hypothetical protein [Nocardioides humi]|uniref:hypothetical protein n=1 Tax=Nocardioides humi TaxID=449461 RepID=UPI001126F61E|nr:hypothetical protein [Nocardioides humi]